MARGRTPLPAGEKSELVNFYIKPRLNDRLKVICFRRSVHRRRKFSEGTLFSGLVVKTPLPKPPSDADIEAYLATLTDKQRAIAEKVRKIVLKPISKKRS